ncbi:alpha-mannosidase, putative [Trichomonas vaginalis G3]|uniref:Alpha-mannosidase, putative n=1 Tax=Trichomonas vaginalis (strain ATCC PRA-98 / G3) TaxID=412133 RepID=A2FU99_TRIV3|nr:mannose metabolic process [Trichomonas vaginalis G3]EAX91530.1 alpha-mannosidase, putative [Trichomonas vaginalis G3]KAI5537942.1 mannose metabolic process [Trichomonas vaginalis G3]|eukprot:XP_001304460.1 alpha-mannosidase [Trichomonas vaginalis G3]
MQDESPVFQSITQISSKQLQLNWTVKQIGEGKAELTTIQQIWSFSGTTIDMTTSVHWTQHDKLLKYVIPTTIRSRKAKFGLQFGYIERETHKNTMRDFARFEASGRCSPRYQIRIFCF